MEEEARKWARSRIQTTLQESATCRRADLCGEGGMILAGDKFGCEDKFDIKSAFQVETIDIITRVDGEDERRRDKNKIYRWINRNKWLIQMN